MEHLDEFEMLLAASLFHKLYEGQDEKLLAKTCKKAASALVDEFYNANTED